MVALAFNGFGLAATADKFLADNPESIFWQRVRYQFSHVEWSGCAFWDMIQPSFMFMVGVSMAYSYINRQERGDSWSRMFGHATVRAVVLCLLGVFLSSNGQAATEWSFMNVLSQIGLGYIFLFLMWQRPWQLQVAVVVAILVGTWAFYTRYPGPPASVSSEVGVTEEWAAKHHQGIAPAWRKNANAGHNLDVAMLNLLPRQKPFVYNGGGYQTINFIPALATMLIGLICGELLRSTRYVDSQKFSWVISIGASMVALGLVWQLFGCPVIKRIWTPSWALLSTGICCIILGLLYGVIDCLKWRSWSFPLVVVGMNSIAIYMMGQLLRPWTTKTLTTHFGSEVFTLYSALDPRYQPMIQATLVGLCFWLACYWMFRNRIFIRI